ncbi:MAG: hypothetical protein KGL99_18015 [Burkholderiales bacterium]|nr:hypothetical protein [Burkholderiales bacterium]
MDRTHRCINRPTHDRLARRAGVRAAALLLGLALAPVCRADSSLQSGAPGGAALSASAHLDFRVTVLPSLSMSTLASVVRIRANSGALTLQRDQIGAADGPVRATSAQLQPHRQVVDTSMRSTAFAAGDRITIASP